MKKVIAFICVLALVVSMCSAFSFAAEPDVKVPQEGTRTGGVHYVVRTAAYMYSEPSANSTLVLSNKIPVGANLVRQNSSTYGPNGIYYKMMYGSYVGYVLASCLTEVQ